MVVRSVAAIGWSDVATLLWTLLSQARRRVRIATANFVPDDRTCKLLCETARGGVDVEVLVPGPYTLRVCQLARAGEVAPLLEAGVRIREDGTLVYYFARNFALINASMTAVQKAQLANIRYEMLGNRVPAKPFLYSKEVDKPEIPNTDFLFR